MHTTYKNICPLVALLITALVAPGCGTEPDAGEAATASSRAASTDSESALHEAGIQDTHSVPIHDAKACALLGTDSLPVRPQSYSVLGAVQPEKDGAVRVAVPVFASYEPAVVAGSLAKRAKAFFGADFSAEAASEDRLTVRFPVQGGMAWAPKRAGGVRLSRHDRVRGVTRVVDSHDAVNRALQQIAELGLLELAEHETLDLMGVSSTHYGGWRMDPTTGETMPVLFMQPPDGELLESYVSERTVSFGRRYRGIPIEGQEVSVTLDAAGRMVSFRKRWRDIVGERELPVELVQLADLDSRRDPEIASLPLREMRCGFLESSSLTYAQDAPGIGCTYEHVNKAGRNTLAGTRYEVVSLTDDPTLSLEGTRLLDD